MDLEKIRSAILSNVEQHGWHIAGVNEDSRNGFPQYAYTVGFGDTLNHPEVIVIGLSHESAGMLLNAVGERIRQHGPLQTEARYTDLLSNGLGLSFVEAPEAKARDLMRFANWYYEAVGDRTDTRYDALQLVWPDADGLLPWEPGFDTRFNDLQPLLRDVQQPPTSSLH
ncbi:DUF4262 domain-containing protein [Rhodovibrio salinarum]|uniref:DUF4262 domain-containing protein n=1 Tax=Rhodovibrio salinarum TaxID=1087 RepID=A0A934V0Z9_9PROT|nr:DUF4262 domain-containing protein [Rhodovibrio salinarum]MBK1697634.1 DUF4262 domain-containing protein [Rhodovibrio salinarum]